MGLCYSCLCGDDQQDSHKKAKRDQQMPKNDHISQKFEPKFVDNNYKTNNKINPLLNQTHVINQSKSNPQTNPINQIHTDNRSKFDTQLQSQELIQKQNSFKSSPQYKKAVDQQCSIQQLLQIASKSHDLKLYTQQQFLYKQTLSKVYQVQNNYSQQSISEIKSHIYSQLVNAVIAENMSEKQADQYFNQAMQAYDKTAQSATIEERITLLNNYSVYKRSCGKINQSKQYLKQAIDLMNIYYIVKDERKYLAMINLACLEYESSKKAQAQMIMDRVIKECKNQEIVRLAEDNMKHYK